MNFHRIRPRIRLQRGNILLIIFGIMTVLAILAPAIVQFYRNESLATGRSGAAAKALQLAEAGIAKAVWELEISSMSWATVQAGSPVAGFNDDKEFTDLDMGTYKIQVASGPAGGKVTITSKGRERSSGEIRSIRAVYSSLAGSSYDRNPALMLKSIHPDHDCLPISGNIIDPFVNPPDKIWWGSVVSFEKSRSYAPSGPALYLPTRTFLAAGAKIDSNPEPPNSDGVRFWHYLSDLGTFPELDFAYYRNKAQASRVPLAVTVPFAGNLSFYRASGTPAAQPANSGYFPETLNASTSTIGLHMRDAADTSLLYTGTITGDRYYFRSSTSVVFVEDDVNNGNAFGLAFGAALIEVEALIVKGGGLFTPRVGMMMPDFGQTYAATIPANAPLEYAYSPSAWNVYASSYNAPNHCCYTTPKVSIHGFVYATEFDAFLPEFEGGTCTLPYVPYVSIATNPIGILGFVMVETMGTATSVSIIREDAIFESAKSHFKPGTGPQGSGPSLTRTAWREVLLPY